jgi:hypothetical protein
MKISKQAILLFLISQPFGEAFQPKNSYSINRQQRNNCLHVASRETREIETQDDKLSYVIARGDGSTGGGGLPMPNSEDEDDGLARPKVGAAMPEG